MKQIAIIDKVELLLVVYEVDEDLTDSEIEEFLISIKFKLDEIAWSEFKEFRDPIGII